MEKNAIVVKLWSITSRKKNEKKRKKVRFWFSGLFFHHVHSACFSVDCCCCCCSKRINIVLVVWWYIYKTKCFLWILSYSYEQDCTNNIYALQSKKQNKNHRIQESPNTITHTFQNHFYRFHLANCYEKKEE